jgi:hyperosmotically inducible periplasmic protein
MTITEQIRNRSRQSLAIGSALLAASFLINVGVAHAASDPATKPAPTAVEKTEQTVADSWITTKVVSEILANSVSKAFKVGVKTESGVVALSGKLPSQDAIDLVKMIAEKVKGVKSVNASGLSIGN